MHLHDSLPDMAVPYQPFHSRRSVVYSALLRLLVVGLFGSSPACPTGAKGMVACSQPLAAEAGRKVLAMGGNAADAGKSRLPHVRSMLLGCPQRLHLLR